MSEIQAINTIFGSIEIDPAQAIYFPHGIIGFKQRNSYCLAEMTEPRLKGYIWLQSTEEKKVLFLTLELLPELYRDNDSLISRQDILQVIELYKINFSDLKVLLIICTNTESNRNKLSVNLKAPIIIDQKKKLGYQHIFVGKNYPLAYCFT